MKWISVKDEYPPYKMNVLFCVGYKIRTGVYVPNYSNEYIDSANVFIGDDKSFFNQSDIYWMQLPETPKLIEAKKRPTGQG